MGFYMSVLLLRPFPQHFLKTAQSPFGLDCLAQSSPPFMGCATWRLRSTGGVYASRNRVALERAVHVHRRTWILTSGRIHGGRLARLGDFCYNGRNEWEERNMVRFLCCQRRWGRISWCSPGRMRPTPRCFAVEGGGSGYRLRRGGKGVRLHRQRCEPPVR